MILAPLAIDWARELGLSWIDAGLVVFVAGSLYVVTVVASRLFGQRQFTTLSSYDMVFTFVLGSVIGRAVLVRTSLAAAVLGLFTLFALHAVTGRLHHRNARAHELIQNDPILVLAEGEPQPDLMHQAHVSRRELHQALRQRGHTRYADLRAVVLEPAGSFSVITRDQSVDPALLEGVLGADRLDAVPG